MQDMISIGASAILFELSEGTIPEELFALTQFSHKIRPHLWQLNFGKEFGTILQQSLQL
jgi:hypothetical protein